MSRLLQINLALLLVSITFFLAALAIPHIGKGAPDWHTVRNPQIPVESVKDDEEAPASSRADSVSSDLESGNEAHPPIQLCIRMRVCVAEPVYCWKYDFEKKCWQRVCAGKRAVTRYLRKTVQAQWLDSLNSYAFYDDYGRLRLLPEFK